MGATVTRYKKRNRKKMGTRRKMSGGADSVSATSAKTAPATTILVKPKALNLNHNKVDINNKRVFVNNPNEKTTTYKTGYKIHPYILYLIQKKIVSPEGYYEDNWEKKLAELMLTNGGLEHRVHVIPESGVDKQTVDDVLNNVYKSMKDADDSLAALFLNSKVITNNLIDKTLENTSKNVKRIDFKDIFGKIKSKYKYIKVKV